MAILTVTATESGTISGDTVSDTETITIEGINSIYHAKFELIDRSSTTSNDSLIYRGGVKASGNGDPYANVRYCRITNVDDSSTFILIIELTDPMYYRLRPGESFILYDFQKYSAVTSEDGSPNPLTDNIESIGHYGGNCWVEIFMASTGGD